MLKHAETRTMFDKSKHDMCPDLAFDFQEYLDKNPHINVSDLALLRDWIQDLDIKKTNVPKDVSDKQLLVFYTACDLDMEATKKCILTYYSIRRKAPGYFNNRDLEDEELKKASGVVEISLIPQRTPDGYDVIINRLKDFNPSNYNYETVTRVFFMVLDRILYERGPCKGLIVIFDMKGFRFGHMFRASISQMRNYFSYVQEGIPIKIHELHVLNAISLFHTVVKILRPFAKKELLDSIKLYSPNYDMDKFFQEVMPTNYMPSDYGGELESVESMYEKDIKYIKDIKLYFDDEEVWRKKSIDNGKI